MAILFVKNIIQNQMTTITQVRTIIPFDPTNTVPFLTVISEPKNVSTILKTLSNSFPIPAAFQHLKRVRRRTTTTTTSKSNVFLEILVQLIEANETTTASEPAAPEIIRAMISSVQVTHVPGQKPQTKEEYEIAQQMWPASFHFNQKTTADSNQELIELQEKGKRWMNEVKEVARATGSLTGCIVVDPTTSSLVARSCDLCDRAMDGIETTNAMLRRRLRTPVMRCIDIVARVHAQTSTRARAIAQRLHESSRISSTSSTTTSSSSDATATHEDTTPPAQLTSQPTTTEAYLLTGLDVYLTHEPSPMEAMALLHSRVGRVFYEQANLNSGVLGSRGMLHEAKTINHRYKVYCICPGRDTGKRSSKVRREEEEAAEEEEEEEAETEERKVDAMKGGRKKAKITTTFEH